MEFLSVECVTCVFSDFFGEDYPAGFSLASSTLHIVSRDERFHSIFSVIISATERPDKYLTSSGRSLYPYSQIL